MKYNTYLIRIFSEVFCISDSAIMMMLLLGSLSLIFFLILKCIVFRR